MGNSWLDEIERDAKRLIEYPTMDGNAAALARRVLALITKVRLMNEVLIGTSYGYAEDGKYVCFRALRDKWESALASAHPDTPPAAAPGFTPVPPTGAMDEAKRRYIEAAPEAGEATCATCGHWNDEMAGGPFCNSNRQCAVSVPKHHNLSQWKPKPAPRPTAPRTPSAEEVENKKVHACGTCAFCWMPGYKQAAEDRECHAHPPSGCAGDNGTPNRWPYVRTDHWCGEWKPSPPREDLDMSDVTVKRMYTDMTRWPDGAVGKGGIYCRAVGLADFILRVEKQTGKKVVGLSLDVEDGENNIEVLIEAQPPTTGGA